MAYKIETYMDQQGQHRFRLKAANGEIAAFGEGIKSEAIRDRTVARLMAAIKAGAFKVGPARDVRSRLLTAVRAFRGKPGVPRMDDKVLAGMDAPTLRLLLKDVRAAARGGKKKAKHG